MYFITWFKHHVTSGWSYQVENRYTDIDTATKSFYSLCGNNVNATSIDAYTCILEAALGNQLEKVAWVKEQITPEQ